MRHAALALALATAGCDSGYGLSVDLEAGCAAGAKVISLQVTPSPSPPQMLDVDAQQFFANGHRVVVVPPDGTTAIELFAVARDAAQMPIATLELDVPVDGHRIDARMVRFDGCRCTGPADCPEGTCTDGKCIDNLDDMTVAPLADLSLTGSGDQAMTMSLPDLSMGGGAADMTGPGPGDLSFGSDGGCLDGRLTPPPPGAMGNFTFMAGPCIGMGGKWQVCTADCNGATVSTTTPGDFDLDAICRQLGYSSSNGAGLTNGVCGIKPMGFVTSCDQMCGGTADYCLGGGWLKWACVP